jgi:endonuclease G
MFDSYNSDRGRLSDATYAAASAYIRKRIFRSIGDPKFQFYQFLSGGPASVKSSAGIEAADGLFVADGSLANLDLARLYLTKALATGKPVSVDYVWAPIETAVAREASRREMEGRVVRDASLAEGHFGAQQTIIKLLSDPEFKDVEFRVWDNSGEKDQQYVVGTTSGEDVSTLPQEEMNKRALDFLRGSDVLYPDENNVRGRLEASRKAVLGTDSARTGPANVGGVVAKGASVNQGGRGTEGEVGGSDKEGDVGDLSGDLGLSSSPNGQGGVSGKGVLQNRKGAVNIAPVDALANALIRAGYAVRPSGRVGTWFRKNFVDASVAVQDFARRLEKAGLTVLSHENPHEIITRFRRTADSLVSQALTNAPVDLWGNVIKGTDGKPVAPLSDAFKGMSDEQQNNFVEYLTLSQDMARLHAKKEAVGLDLEEQAEYGVGMNEMVRLQLGSGSANFLVRGGIVWRWNQAMMQATGLDSSPDVRATGEKVSHGLGTPHREKYIKRTTEMVEETVGVLGTLDIEETETFMRIVETFQDVQIPLWDFKFEMPEDGRRITVPLEGSGAPIWNPHDTMMMQAAGQILKARLFGLLSKQVGMRLEPMDKAEATRIFAETQAMFDRFLEKGVEDADGNVIGPALNPAFEGLDSGQYRKFLEYLHALRTVALVNDEFHGVRGSGMSVFLAQEIVAENAGTDFERRAQIVHEWNAAVLDYLVSTDSVRGDNFFGEEVGYIRRSDPGSYIPLWRNLSEDAGMYDPYPFGWERGEDAGMGSEGVKTQTEVEDTRQVTRTVPNFTTKEVTLKKSKLELAYRWRMSIATLVERLDLAPDANLLTFIKGVDQAFSAKPDIRTEAMDSKTFVERQTQVARDLMKLAQTREVTDAVLNLAKAAPREASQWVRPANIGALSNEVLEAMEKAANWGRAKGMLANATDQMEKTLMPVMEDAGTGTRYVYDGTQWFEVEKGLYDGVAAMHAQFGSFGTSLFAQGLRDWGASHGSVARAAVGVPLFAVGRLDSAVRLSTRFFRAAATAYNPRFGLVTNVVRDLETLMYNTRALNNPQRALRHWFASLSSAAVEIGSFGTLKPGEFSDWKGVFDRLGLGQAQTLGQDSAPLKLAVEKVKGETTWRTLSHDGWELLTNVLQFPESAARISEMRVVGEKLGWNPSMELTPEIAIQLANAAKGVTVDFTRAGKMAQVWNAYVPFFNSQIQGKVSVYEAIKRNPLQWLATRGLVVALMAAANWMRNKDEDKWKNLTTQEKFSYGWVKLPGGEWLRIPRAFEVDAVFAAGTTALLEAVWGSDPDAVREWAKLAFENFSVVGSLDGTEKSPSSVRAMGVVSQAAYRGLGFVNQDAMPVFLREALAQGFNEDKFWKRRIVPKSIEDDAAEDQYGPYTNGLAVKIGKATGFSPMRIEHLLHSFWAGTGGTISRAIFGSGDGDDVSSELDKRDWEPADMPIVGVLFSRGGDTPNPSNAPAVQKFYDVAGQVMHDWDTNGGNRGDQLVMFGAVNALKAVGAVLKLYRASADKATRDELAKLAIDLATEATADIETSAVAAKSRRYGWISDQYNTRHYTMMEGRKRFAEWKPAETGGIQDVAATALKAAGLDSWAQKLPIFNDGNVVLDDELKEGKHTLGGLPKSDRPLIVLKNEGYVVGWDKGKRNPAWVAYSVEPAGYEPGKRPDFKEDERTPKDARTRWRVGPQSISGSGYDRGHMAPNKGVAVTYGPKAQGETFLMSNIAPQLSDLNRTFWKEMEHKIVDDYAARWGKVWVVTGPVFDGGKSPRKAGTEFVRVPDGFFMIVSAKDGAAVRQQAIYVPHRDVKSTADPSLFRVSVRELETMTGLDFAPQLSERDSDALEGEPVRRVW